MRAWAVASLVAVLAGCATPEESSTGDGTGDIADRDGTIGDGVEDAGNPLDGGEANESVANATTNGTPEG